MSNVLDILSLEKAFQGRPDIIGAIKAAAQAPEWIELFNVIDGYVCELRDSRPEPEPPSKKRRLEESLTHNPSPNGAANPAGQTNGVVSKQPASQPNKTIDSTTLLQIKEISFVLPQRKKFAVEFTPTHILARNLTNQELVPGIEYAWEDIAYAFCVPVPEKSAKQYNYILFPKASNLPSKSNPTVDPLILTIPATPPKPGAISGKEAAAASIYSDTHKDVFDWFISTRLKDVGSVVVEEPSEKQFVSSIKEAHRPSEKATFVKAFRGSKDGYLFFMSTGILFCFKKPVIFVPKDQIVAVSYTNVLQRTFNLLIEAAMPNPDAAEDGEAEEEFEFGMLDQEDFEGIDTYIKRHGLQDQSMGEQRKAQRLGVNDIKGEDGKVVEVEVGELEKAEQELQDEEDEEEEDYDPGSEGESEGSGSDTSGDEGSEAGDRSDGGEEGDEEAEDEDEEDDE